MHRRSRGGCIGCRKSKVKCDENKPSCGTCRRRRIACQGYGRRDPFAERGTHRPTSKNAETEREGPMKPVGIVRDDHPAPIASPQTEEGILITRPFSRFNEPMTTSFSSQTFPKAGHPLIMDPSIMTPRAIGLIPPGVVDESDQATIEVYFTRHPWELSISAEFVHEMNANVLAVLQQNPRTIVDSLSAIGHSYMTGAGSESSLVVLNYRARILAALRSMEVSHCLEQMIFLFLSLCAIELVDCKSAATETTIPAIVANSSVLITHYVSTGRKLSSLARYFIRALARQDMIISLIYAHRPMIPTAVWLDEEAKTLADRLMGYTTTLMPLLEELCVLAEELRGSLHFTRNCPPDYSGYADEALGSLEYTPHIPRLQEHNFHTDMTEMFYDGNPDPATVYPPPAIAKNQLVEFEARRHKAEDLRKRIEHWKPTLPHGLSFRMSRRFLIQANSYRAGALLYLFRLLHPPTVNGNTGLLGYSAVDGEATAMAHELLVSLGPPSARGDEAKMLLWPVFVAASEMLAEEDRQMVLDIFDVILEQRKTATVQRTKSFVLNRVWPARDAGREWSWWVLAKQFPGECLPI